MMYLRLASATLVLAALVAAQPPPATDPKDLATLSGKTVSTEGQPLKKTALSLRSVGGAAGSGLVLQNYTAISDGQGKFVFEGLQPGRYQLTAERQGYLRQNYGSKRSMGVGTILTLSKGEEVKDLTFPLTPHATISGKVLDDDGDPVANASVSAMRSDFMNGKRQMMPVGQANSDEGGDYKIGGLAPGRYYLVASKQRGMFMSDAAPPDAKPGKIEEDLVTTYYPSVTDSSSATPIDTIAGRSAPGTDIRLRKAQVVRVRGKLVGLLPNQSMERLRLMLLPSGASMMTSMMTSIGSGSVSPTKDGSFELTGVPAGSFTLAATNMQGMIQILARQQVEVGSQNLDGLVLTMQTPSDLRGTVKTEGEPKTAPGDAARVAPPSLRVTLRAFEGAMFTPPQGTVNADGTFVLPNISPGKYRLSVYGNPDGAYLKAIRLGDRDVLAEGLDLSDGASGAVQVIFSTAAAEIGGSVQADGQPVAAGAVTLVPDPPRPEQTRLYPMSGVDQNGKFTFKNLAPGKYVVYAWEELEPGAQYDPEFLKPLESLGARVTVGENGKEQVAVTRISAATVDEARQKSGR